MAEITSTRPNSDSVLIEKPKPIMTAKVPMIDTGTAIYAARLAADPKSLMQRAADDGKVYPGVMVNGQFVVTGPPLMKKDPPKSAAAPAAPAPAKPLPAAARPLPTSLDAVPGAKDTSQRVARGTDLMVR